MPAKPMTLLRLSTTANVGTFHAFSRSNAGYYYGRPLLRPYLERLHRGIAVSEPARTFFSRYFPDFPLRIIPNGIDTSVYRPGLSPIRHLRDDKVNILFVGRLEKRKGLGDLLRAYELMRSRVMNARLIIVGDGPLRGSAESFISRHRLPDVVMAGFVPNFVLPRYYARADRLRTAHGRLPAPPNPITVVGPASPFLPAVLAAFGQLRWAGVALASAGTFDILDGARARPTHSYSPYGAFLDSPLHRYSQGA